eukprot:COSAG02_NODE_3842_length_6160_cov_48.195842_3_plen_64_part_00
MCGVKRTPIQEIGRPQHLSRQRHRLRSSVILLETLVMLRSIGSPCVARDSLIGRLYTIWYVQV